MTRSSRRRFLAAAGASALAAGCATHTSGSRAQAEAIGAFPTLPGGADLIGPEPGVARLHSNENPYGPAPSAVQMMDYATRKGAYYSGRIGDSLIRVLAEQHEVAPEQITLSTGSAEALNAIAIRYGQQGKILTPRLFFDATVMYAKRLGLADVVRAPMAADLSMDFAALESMIDDGTALVQICNPNNPTGLLSDTDMLKASVTRMSSRATVVVDEAYMELTDQPERHSCVDLVRAGHDVIVSRTFSKLYGMAGIRVGYTVSSAQAAQEIRHARMTWMSGVGIAAALGCHDDQTFIRRSKTMIVEAREMVLDTLAKLGVPALPSQGNFVYFNSGQDANLIQQRFSDRGIKIRGTYMDYTTWSRVSMGKLEDVSRFCRTLPDVLEA